MADRHMLLPAVLTLLLRAASATTGCDGSVNVPEECLFEDNTLSYCECNLCQTYKMTEVYGGTPSIGPGISTSHMIPGVQSNHTLCLYHWTFFKVPTRSPGHDGVDEPKGVVFYLDTDFKSEQNRFTSVDVLEVTRGALPDAWSDVHTLAYPKDAFGLNQITYSPEGRPMSWRGDGARWLLKQDSYMYTAGYDDEGEGCRGTQKEFMYVGVRCGDQQDSSGWVWPDQPCKFKVRLEHLPYELRGGDTFDKVPIQPGTTHFYWLHVGEYDVVRIHFARQGNNLTASTNDAGCPECVQSNGHGLIGVLRFDVDACPSGGNARQEHALGNGTTEMTLEWFCTQGGEGGRYTLGLEAAAIFDPDGGAPGYEFPDGSKAAGTPEQLEKNRMFNPGGNDNQLRAARGSYRISVFHLTFNAGPIAAGERRSGCISYGHWRHFTLVTEGVGDASLVAKVEERTEEGEVLDGMPLSALYVRRNKRPDAAIYDARAQHPTDELVLSPCDLHEPRQWHLGVHLEYELKANSVGLYRGYFVLRAVTESGEGASYSSAEWPQPGEPPRLFVMPRAEGGTGHTCCGQVHPNLALALALALALTL